MKTQILQPLGWILLSAAAALAIWIVAVPLLGIPLTVRFGGGPEMAITPVPVLVSSIVPGLAGWALLAVLRRYLSRGSRIWMIAAAVALALSMAGPLGVEAATATKVVLVLMHLVVAAVLVLGLPRSPSVQRIKRGTAARSQHTQTATPAATPKP